MKTNMNVKAQTEAPAGAPRTVAEALGQVVWVLSQSPTHRELPIKDLEWSVMPAIVTEQFRIFRFGPLPGLDRSAVEKLAPTGMALGAIEQLPLGVALWARLSPQAEERIESGERLRADEWKSGDRVWLMELVSPFATPQNKLVEVMLLDLIQGPFRQTPFSLHRTDPATGRRDTVRMSGHIAKPAQG
jgi:cytolysin-activating lysine-acyltransferase